MKPKICIIISLLNKILYFVYIFHLIVFLRILTNSVSSNKKVSSSGLLTINVFLSEHKNDFCCIVAGYKDEIKKCFFSVNQGLERRFPWRHDIEEYTDEDLYRIFIKMIIDTKWELTEEVTKEFIIQIIKDNRDLFKHTGGSIETFISKLKMIHSKRVFPLEKEFKFKFTKEDLNNCITEVKKHSEKKIKANYDYYT